jgi:GTP pyrophosphokinase
LHRAGVGAVNQEKIAQKLHFQKLEDFLAAIGRGDVSEHQIALAIQEEVAPRPEESVLPLAPKRISAPQSQTGVVVEGVGNLQTSIAKCCKPMPGEAIVGYLTRDHGVTIHRKACTFIVRLPESRHNRVLVAQWGNGQNLRTDVDIEVEAHDRQGLLRDISDLFAREKVNAIKANTMSRNNLALMQFSIEVLSLEQLSRLLALIQHVPNVIVARRRD